MNRAFEIVIFLCMDAHKVLYVLIWFPHRGNMTQQRFNNLAVLHTHQARTDRIDLVKIANAFVKNENRLRNFGKFTEHDICYSS